MNEALEKKQKVAVDKLMKHLKDDSVTKIFENVDIKTDPGGKSITIKPLPSYIRTEVASALGALSSKVRLMKIHDSDDTSRSVINMHGYNDGIVEASAAIDTVLAQYAEKEKENETVTE